MWQIPHYFFICIFCLKIVNLVLKLRHMKTFFIESKNFNNNQVFVDGEEHNHLKNVLRLKPGDNVKVVCGDKFDYFCTIDQINKNNSVLIIDSKQVNTANPKANLTAYVALIKNDKMSLIIQKLTELGVSNIVPFESRYTVIKDQKNKYEKLQQISNQSIKQCGRSIPATIMPTINISNINISDHDIVLFANESEQKVMLNQVIPNADSNVAIIIGPEGGFTEDEKNMLINKGAKSISLGNRILRAETAAIMLTTLVLNILGEF